MQKMSMCHDHFGCSSCIMTTMQEQHGDPLVTLKLRRSLKRELKALSARLGVSMSDAMRLVLDWYDQSEQEGHDEMAINYERKKKERNL